jgi:hypothetical protein
VSEVQQVMMSQSSTIPTEAFFSQDNKGPHRGVTEAIDWFFRNEEEGVVLEDDCLPDLTFFSYAEQILDAYRHDDRVWGCGGFNPSGVRFEGSSYGFIRFALMSGAWATWSDRWFARDDNLARYRRSLGKSGKQIWPTKGLFHGINWHLRRSLGKRPDFWDYQLSWSVAEVAGLWAVSSKNLALNLGFRDDATHGTKNPWPEARLEALETIKHPAKVEVDLLAERILIRRHLRVYRPYWLNYARNGVRWLKILVRKMRK